MGSNRHRPSFAIPVTPGWQPLIDYLEGMENHHVRSEWLRNAAWLRMLMDQGLLALGGQDAGAAAPAPVPAPPQVAVVRPVQAPQIPQPHPVPTKPASSPRAGPGMPRPTSPPKPAMPPTDAGEADDGVNGVEGLDEVALRGLRQLAGVR